MVRTLAIGLALLIGCGGAQPGEQDVVATLERLVVALEARDHDELWALSDPGAREDLLALHGELHAALQRVPEVYAESTDDVRAAARAALGQALVGDIPVGAEGTGPQLLARLLDPEALRFDDHARDGVSHREVTFDADGPAARAIVQTTGGETFQFVRADDGWRSLMLQELLRSDPRLAELRANAAKVAALEAQQRAIWRSEKSPETPHGAYNVLREALSADPPNGPAIYTLLDQAARDQLVAVLERAREVQRLVQRRTTLKTREEGYARYDLGPYVKANSDRALYVHWVGSEGYAPPVVVDDPPIRVEGDVASGTATIITEGGRSYTFTREDDGYWHLAGQAAAIDDALGGPVRAALEQLQR